jgi:TRAP transporter TAXI family solute receptor
MGTDAFLVHRRRFLRALAAVFAAALAPGVRAALTRIAIGANPAGTNFNLVAGGFAKTLQQSLGVPSIVRPYAGSSVYIPLLERGEIPLGINSSIDSYLSYTGSAPYAAAMRHLRALMSVYPLDYMYWVRAESGLERVEDLRGRRVVLDYRSLVPLGRLNRAILASGGLTEKDIVPVTAAGLPEGARLVVEGRADAAAMGYRLPLVRQMHATLPGGGLRFLQMGRDEERVPRIMPGARVTTVLPDESSVGIDGPTRVAVYDTYLNTGTHLSADDAYRIVAALHAAWSQLRKDYAVLAPVASDALCPADVPLPYHDGAVRYFREIGLWTDAHDANQARVLAPTTG